MNIYVINKGRDTEETIEAKYAKREGKHVRFYNLQNIQSEIRVLEEGDTIEPNVPPMQPV